MVQRKAVSEEYKRCSDVFRGVRRVSDRWRHGLLLLASRATQAWVGRLVHKHQRSLVAVISRGQHGPGFGQKIKAVLGLGERSREGSVGARCNARVEVRSVNQRNASHDPVGSRRDGL